MTDDELIENADLLPGETPPIPDDSYDEEDLPVRLLDNFAIYDWETLCLVPITELHRLKSGLCYGASGSVKPCTDDDTDEDGSDDETEARSTLPYILKLSPILELNVHHFSPEAGRLDMWVFI
jgi:DNA (cytosine-5)-methyltransferase 1